VWKEPLNDEQLPLIAVQKSAEGIVGGIVPLKAQTSPSLMVRVLDRDNLIRALKQVQRNKGAPGTDGVTRA